MFHASSSQALPSTSTPSPPVNFSSVPLLTCTLGICRAAADVESLAFLSLLRVASLFCSEYLPSLTLATASARGITL